MSLVSTGPHVPALTSTAPQEETCFKGEAEELTDRGVEVEDIFLFRWRVGIAMIVRRKKDVMTSLRCRQGYH